MKPKDEKPVSADEFTRFGQALMQVSKEELADVIASEERDKPKRADRQPPKSGK